MLRATLRECSSFAVLYIAAYCDSPTREGRVRSIACQQMFPSPRKGTKNILWQGECNGKRWMSLPFRGRVPTTFERCEASLMPPCAKLNGSTRDKARLANNALCLRHPCHACQCHSPTSYHRGSKLGTVDGLAPYRAMLPSPNATHRTFS